MKSKRRVHNFACGALLGAKGHRSDDQQLESKHQLSAPVQQQKHHHQQQEAGKWKAVMIRATLLHHWGTVELCKSKCQLSPLFLLSVLSPHTTQQGAAGGWRRWCCSLVLTQQLEQRARRAAGQTGGEWRSKQEWQQQGAGEL